MRDSATGPAIVPLHWRTFVIALAAAVVFFAAVWICTPPAYFTNDDVVVRLGIEGRLVPGQPPTGFMLYTHSALAWTLAWLHARTTLPLWDAATIGTLICAMAILVALCWPAVGGGWLLGGMVTAALAVSALPLMAGVQFTISAAVAGGAAMALCFVELASTRRRRSVLLVAALMLIAGELVRPMGAAAGALGIGAMLAPLAVSAPAHARRTRLTALAAAIAGVLIVSSVLQYVDGLTYRLDPIWDAYRQYHLSAARFLEWSGQRTPDDVAAIRSAVGWSSNDWQLLERWLGVDPKLHGFDQIARAIATDSDGVAWWLGGMAGIQRRLALFVDVMNVQRLVVESNAVLIVAITVAIVCGRIRQAGILVAVIVSFVLFCLAIEVAFKELPFRLLAPLQLCLATVAVLTIGAARRTPPPLLSIIGVSLLLTLAVRQLSAVTTRLDDGVRQAAQVEEEVRKFSRLGPTLVVLHADAFPEQIFWRPLVQPADAPPTVRLDYNSQSPSLQRFLSESGRQPLLRALCQDPSILIVSERDRLQPVTVYMREHFGVDVQWTKVFDASFRAWRCTPRTTPGQP